MGLVQFEEFERRSFKGMTYKDTYFMLPQFARDESLHFHELVHVVQWGYLGVHGLLLGYAKGLLDAEKYEDNPLESIACQLEEYFTAGKQPFNVENYIVNEVSQQLMTPENQPELKPDSERKLQ